jgi:hypothetical protein
MLDEARFRRDFRACVNLSADELEAWLDTPESRWVGFKKDDGESVGHASGRHILDMLRAPPGLPDEPAWSSCARWSVSSVAIAPRNPPTWSRRAGAIR